MDAQLEKLRVALAELDAKVQPETDELYYNWLVRYAKPSPVPAMTYNLRTEAQAALAGYRSRDAEIKQLQDEIDNLKRLGKPYMDETTTSQHASALGAIGGRRKSDRKSQASRANGQKGGRPKRQARGSSDL